MPALLKHQQALATVGTSTNIMDKTQSMAEGGADYRMQYVSTLLLS
jgi:hypothetical protein